MQLPEAIALAALQLQAIPHPSPGAATPRASVPAGRTVWLSPQYVRTPAAAMFHFILTMRYEL